MQPSLRCLRRVPVPSCTLRSFSSTVSRPNESLQTTTSAPAQPPPALDPNLVSTREDEALLRAQGKLPIGSRRRRAALQTSQNIPFEQLPYQCFQEARKILAADRAEKLQQIETERRRIARVEASVMSEQTKKGKLVRMREHLDRLKILADVNDPGIKKRFEDGQGDMNRPIYRYLADRKWRSYARKLLMQRLTQMYIVPDLLPYLNPVASTTLSFGRYAVAPGAFVPALISARAPSLAVQVFDAGLRLVTLAVVDADVPNLATDAFDARCHFLAANIEIGPTAPRVGPLDALDAARQVVLPWMPPHAQKGSPYHRIAVFVLQQHEGRALDVESIREREGKRLGFGMRGFVTRYRLKVVGTTMFRNQWDEGTRTVMERAGLEGADVELKRKRGEALPEKYKRKDGERYR